MYKESGKVAGTACKLQAEMNQRVWTQDHLAGKREWAKYNLTDGRRTKDLKMEDIVGN